MAVSELLLFCFLSCREIGLRVGLVLSRDEKGRGEAVVDTYSLIRQLGRR